jgi:hypothetical protein
MMNETQNQNRFQAELQLASEVRSSEVKNQLDGSESLTARINESVNMLRETLSPIIRKTPQEGAATVKISQNSLCFSDLSRRLHSNNCVLGEILNVLQDLRDAVDL